MDGGLGLAPGSPSVGLAPDTVCRRFNSWRELRANLRPNGLLVIGLALAAERSAVVDLRHRDVSGAEAMRRMEWDLDREDARFDV